MMKYISIILLIIITFTIISCANSDTPITPTAGDVEIDETSITEIDHAPEKKDFAGYDFRFMTMENKNARIYVADELTGETINDAVYIRNRSVEDKYNITISLILYEANNAGVVSAVTKNVQADIDVCDIALIQAHSLFPVAQQGFLHNWFDFDEVRLEKPWWDQRMTQELAIKNKLYTIIGEFTTCSSLGTMVVFYNKKLAGDYGYNNIYNSVLDGKWTFDNFWNMVVNTNEDLNGDGKMDQNDLWGILTEYSALYYFYNGSGYRSIQPKGNNEYVLTIGTEKAYNIVEKILVIGTEKNYSLIADDGKLTGSYDTTNGMFINDQGLFYAGSFGDITRYRVMQSDYGVLPIPKYEEIQDSYYCLVTWGTMPATMPISVKDPNRTALILEALAYESSLGLTDAFYEVFLVDKLARDNETKTMFDIIFASKTFDLDWYAGISGFLSILNTIGQTGRNNFASENAKIESQAQIRLDEFLSKFN